MNYSNTVLCGLAAHSISLVTAWPELIGSYRRLHSILIFGQTAPLLPTLATDWDRNNIRCAFTQGSTSSSDGLPVVHVIVYTRYRSVRSTGNDLLSHWDFLSSGILPKRKLGRANRLIPFDSRQYHAVLSMWLDVAPATSGYSVVISGSCDGRRRISAFVM